jgi:hypothetical protein
LSKCLYVTAIFFIGENLPNIEDYLVLLAKTLKMIWFLLTYLLLFFLGEFSISPEFQK